MKKWVACVVAVALAAGAGACSRKTDSDPPVATPAFKTSKARAALGSPVDLEYQFALSKSAPRLDRNYRVLVHFLDSDQELIFTDDHNPPKATTTWQPGEVVTYRHTMFIPVYPYIGQTTVLVGLYDPETGKRLPLAGENNGQRAYKVGTMELLPQSENVFLIFKEGWHPAEVAPDNATVEWQWTKKDALLSLRNPLRDATLFLDLNGRTDLVPNQSLTVKIGDQVLDAFALPVGEERMIRRVPISAAQFGKGEMVDIALQVSETFVPARLPSARSSDPRELGVRVFHAFVEPKG